MINRNPHLESKSNHFIRNSRPSSPSIHPSITTTKSEKTSQSVERPSRTPTIMNPTRKDPRGTATSDTSRRIHVATSIVDVFDVKGMDPTGEVSISDGDVSWSCVNDLYIESFTPVW